MPTYENYGIKLQYPNNWTYKEKVDNWEVVLSPPNPSGGIFREEFGVDIFNAQNKSAAQLGQENLQSLRNQSWLEDLKVDASEQYNFQGKPAYRLVVTLKRKGRDTIEKIARLYVVKDKNLYVLSFRAKLANYPQYVETVKKIISSFQ